MIEVKEKVPGEVVIPPSTINVNITRKVYYKKRRKSKQTNLNIQFAKDVIIAVLTVYIAFLRDTFACKNGLATFVCAAVLVAAITIVLFSTDVNDVNRSLRRNK